MSWATPYIDKLKKGETVKFRPRGESMKPKIKSGELVTVEPLTEDHAIGVGDIVLCKVHGRQFLHLVKSTNGKTYTIGNNHGFINGTIGRGQIYGICTKVEP